jgi:hypothetical protein
MLTPPVVWMANEPFPRLEARQNAGCKPTVKGPQSKEVVMAVDKGLVFPREERWISRPWISRLKVTLCSMSWIKSKHTSPSLGNEFSIVDLAWSRPISVRVGVIVQLQNIVYPFSPCKESLQRLCCRSEDLVDAPNRSHGTQSKVRNSPRLFLIRTQQSWRRHARFWS